MSQKQANVWYFGKKIGLDFNVDPPLLLLDGQIDYDNTPDNLEATASIADENGMLLFYTNGVTVWNKLHGVMPNGTGLFGRNTTTQTLIVPKPGTDSLFYIFTASPEGDDDFYPPEKKGFRYSVVDLSRENGMGDVVEKNVLLNISTTEKIAATKHINGRDVWVVIHEWDNNVFKAYLISENGINTTPVTSHVGEIHSVSDPLHGAGNSSGQMKISPNGEKLALVTYISNLVEVFHFDPSNGKLKLMGSLSLSDFTLEGRLYGLEFSMGSRFLYLTANQCDILQLDLNGNLRKDRVLKVSETPPCNESSQLQLAPNGKIYVAQFTKLIIGVIDKPDEPGVLSGYQYDAINIPADGIHSCNIGLPNFISTYFYNPGLYPQNPYFEMPNVFTPNSDGYNDKFIPRQNYNIASAQLALFNRWGQKIHETTDLESGWDGNGFSPGIYYWIVQYQGMNGKQATQKGLVQLVRDH